MDAVLEREPSASLLKNTSFQRKVELHWKSKIRSKDEGAAGGAGGQATTRTQSVSPTAQLYDFDAYINSQMLSMETANSFDSRES